MEPSFEHILSLKSCSEFTFLNVKNMFAAKQCSSLR